ncbi:MAG: hypothetical protein Ct9H90mP13_07160 [Pseudomonadota bacterium]|nr:MAG: hypothetical protein Ct9H90mP13_07160 [Pseudomonadota bacterium]
MVCNPAIKTKADQIALINALKKDRIDIIATDHALTHQRKKRNLIQIVHLVYPVQHSLLALLEIVEKTNTNRDHCEKNQSCGC